MPIYWSDLPVDTRDLAGGIGLRAPVSRRSRRAEVFDLLTAGDGRTPLVQQACEVAVSLLDMTGAGLCLVGGARHQVVVYGTDHLAHELEDLQATHGEGPCVQAVRTGCPVLAPDLRTHRPDAWPAYAEEARARGVLAAFSFPLHAGPVQVGSLDMYRRRPGALDAAALADACALVDITTRAALAHRGRSTFEATVDALRRLGVGERAPGAGRSTMLDLEVTVEQTRALRRRTGTVAPAARPDRPDRPADRPADRGRASTA